MNQFETYTKRLATGFIAYLRTPADDEAKPILGPGGKEQLFPTREKALECINRHLVRYVNGHLYRFGSIAGAEMNEAEKSFKDTVKQKGKTRTISVTYKGKPVRWLRKK